MSEPCEGIIGGLAGEQAQKVASPGSKLVPYTATSSSGVSQNKSCGVGLVGLSVRTMTMRRSRLQPCSRTVVSANCWQPTVLAPAHSGQGTRAIAGCQSVALTASPGRHSKCRHSRARAATQMSG